ncbi:MAG: hypothetical protein GEU81_02800, partial [Nitriliruptorales bacterium]|nr:hypothetical protein [Nitriliruptorales bacterium]
MTELTNQRAMSPDPDPATPPHGARGREGAPVAVPTGGPLPPPWVGWTITILVVGLLATAPLVVSQFSIRVLTNALMLAAMAQSLNIITGFTGRADFGNVVYFGIGAYTTGHLINMGLPTVAGIAAGALLCSTMAFLIGFPILRLRGHYFAIATIGVMEGTRELIVNSAFLGGGSGMSTPIFQMDPDVFFF